MVSPDPDPTQTQSEASAARAQIEAQLGPWISGFLNRIQKTQTRHIQNHPGCFRFLQLMPCCRCNLGLDF